MKREAKSASSEGTIIQPKDTKLWERFPLLTEHLVHTVWEDGKPRTTSTLTVSFADGALVMCLNDREEARGMFVTVETFLEGLKALETNLGDGGGSRWVRWKKWKK